MLAIAIQCYKIPYLLKSKYKKKHSTRPQTTNKLIEWNFPFVWSLRCATDPLSSKKFNQFSCNKANLKSLHWEAEKGETKWNWWNFLKTTLETPFLLFAERTLYITYILYIIYQSEANWWQTWNDNTISYCIVLLFLTGRGWLVIKSVQLFPELHSI